MNQHMECGVAQDVPFFSMLAGGGDASEAPLTHSVHP